MGNNIFGIDIGTSNIRIYNQADNSIFMEKNMIAIENKNQLLAYGDSAYDMFEKAPSNIVTSYPVVNGVIADINNMETLIKLFISDLSKGNIKPADYYIAVPTDVTEVEKRAFYDLIKDSGVKAKKIMVVEKAVADGLGLGIDVKNSIGVMVVNVGYSTTEISILSLGGIVLSKLIKVGGYVFDDDIRNIIRKEYNLIIGQKSAEKIKISLADFEKEGKNAVAFGRDIVTGLPMEREIPTELLDSSLVDSFSQIIDNIKVILERTPPELGADIYRHGIYLTGGASKVSKLADLISKSTGLTVNVCESPIDSVAEGLSKVINEDKYRKLAYTIEGMSAK
ncbi:MAG: rod shape-determining protein [Lachnospiraceae bacterium]|nr:rod shape-determining protein [Candidatus Colinaster equi]